MHEHERLINNNNNNGEHKVGSNSNIYVRAPIKSEDFGHEIPF